jgi:hypothetical protein
MMRAAAGRLLFLLIFMPCAVGCGTKSEGPETYPVTGVVTLKSAPVDGAVLQFTPTSPDAGIAGAQAMTNPDGTFEVKINLDMGKTTKMGLPPGDYKVAITKLQVAPGQSAPNIPPKNVLPPEYATIESSPLTATVKADGENRFEFPL